MRIVFDSNVLLSAYATHGLCESLFEKCLGEQEVYLSAPILEEVSNHLKGKFRVPSPLVDQILAFLRSECVLVEPADIDVDACRDDLMVLGTAITASASCIVTGDKDLLSLGPFQTILIQSPRTLYDALLTGR